MLLFAVLVHAAFFPPTPLPQQFYLKETILVNAQPRVLPAANFTREVWFDAKAGKELTVATHDQGGIEGQFVDVVNVRQCNFHTVPGSADASNITCSCQKIPFAVPLVNQLNANAQMIGLQDKIAAWANKSVSSEVWQVVATIPGSIAKPIPVIETCNRFIEHDAPHRDVAMECYVCPKTSAPVKACASTAQWLERMPFPVYKVGPPSPSVLIPPPQCV
jgi:hypothetical protein